MRHVTLLFAGFCLFLVGVLGSQGDAALFPQTFTFQQGVSGYSHDGTQARGGEPTVSFGGSINLDFGKLDNQPTRNYFGFNLTGIPTWAQITDASLALTVKGIDGDGANDTLNLHQINAAGPIVEGILAQSDPDDGLSWNTRDGTNAWGTAGGDYNATVLATLTNGNGGAPGNVHTFGSTALLAAAADGSPIVGGLRRLELILVSPTYEAGPNDFRTYHSDDAALISNRPLLTITALVPEPTGGIALIGALTTAGLLRRRPRIG